MHDAVRADVLTDLEREPMALYEVLYSANTLFPDRPASERVAVAEQVVAGLVADDMVSLWRGLWVGPEHERSPVPHSDLDGILRTWSTWSPEAGEPGVWMELVRPRRDGA